MSLSAFRAGHLIAYDKVAEPLRKPFTETQHDPSGAGDTVVPKGSGTQKALGELVACPICVGTWVGAFLTYGLMFIPGPTRVLLAILSATGVAELLHGLGETLKWNGQLARNRSGQDYRVVGQNLTQKMGLVVIFGLQVLKNKPFNERTKLWQYGIDLLVIGGGSAGSTAVTNLQGRNLKIALVERTNLAGRASITAATQPRPISILPRNSITPGKLRNSVFRSWMPTFRGAQSSNTSAKPRRVFRGGTPEEAERNYKEAALFKGRPGLFHRTKSRSTGNVYAPEQIIIATGTKASVPPIQGLKEAGYITNVEAVSLPALPKRLAIMGGGPIGVEFSQIFARFGVEVTVLRRCPDCS